MGIIARTRRRCRKRKLLAGFRWRCLRSINSVAALALALYLKLGVFEHEDANG
jgi:hypothetical protein